MKGSCSLRMYVFVCSENRIATRTDGTLFYCIRCYQNSFLRCSVLSKVGTKGVIRVSKNYKVFAILGWNFSNYLKIHLRNSGEYPKIVCFFKITPIVGIHAVELREWVCKLACVKHWNAAGVCLSIVYSTGCKSDLIGWSWCLCAFLVTKAKSNNPKHQSTSKLPKNVELFSDKTTAWNP